MAGRFVKVEQMPEQGEIVIAHTTNEKRAQRVGEYLEVDYLLHHYCPPDKIYIMDITLFRKLFGCQQSP
jgi:coenzyme F420-reducing hydrogenase gamma subunit